MVKKVIPCLIAVSVLAWAPSLKAETWKGKISDSMCGSKHADEHGGKKLTERECVEACIKGNAKYVFSADSKVFKIANQDYAGLKTHAGHEVMLTGDMKDDTITITKIEMPAKAK
jgi:hypothetical protein